ncbi:bifunctional 4-hydroxy-2-oxoglutarate aldolase/2-dehydro-3-deoxy-phosphogluconate aldolase [Evansella halocellulosilytica]|uniref:bifunctional 4-hydroxy-2-oxoglutarate aldolase/2-dehydro-3-deoxy-phosphogluconate aldolase n=1 Tax=Evansella halocellulosilytica TaxID=2011013 RepID=UPI000BB816B2|nr:bifunctional 4-hydroxy-2-oxoglutarate aldolase/2-dehydro-3-deoxy-phosphogluconate aldolase [Evansella halocellulosilytica]
MCDYKLKQIVSSGIVAVVRRVDPDKVPFLVKALINGGVSSIEITMDSEKARDKINELKEAYGDTVAIGAGTVLEKSQAKEAIMAGADFIFAPTLNREVIEYTKQEGKIMIPGVFTPTEIYNGYKWGADILKVFPANILGPQFFKDVKGPMNDIPMMPTGGIDLDNIEKYIEVGVVAVGVGGSLLKAPLIAENKWGDLEKLAHSFVQRVEDARLNK